MSPQDAIAQSRISLQTPGARWPANLVAYLGTTLDERSAIDWSIACVSELLNTIGKSTKELRESLIAARQYNLNGGDSELIEQRAKTLWIRRTKEGEPTTAVAQLLFALTRASREGAQFSPGSFATPLCILERLELQSGEVFDLVIAHFLRYLDADLDERDGI